MYDYIDQQDQETDELVYGKCKHCGQLEELGPDDLCYICEGIERTTNGRPKFPAT